MVHERDMRSRWRKAVPTLLAVMAVLTLGGAIGCSDNAGSDDGEVKVGVLVPLTGEFGSFGEPWQRAMELAADDVNEVGGLPDDANLELVVDDEQTDPEAGVQAARKMIDSNGVAAILGPTSGPAVAIAPIARRSEVPLILPAASTVQLNQFGGEYVFRTVATDAEESLPIARYLTKNQATTVSVLAENDESQISVAESFRENFEGEGSGSVAASITFNAGAASYRTQVSEALGADPDWVVCACGEQSGATIIKELDEAGYEGEIIVTSDMTTPDAIKAVGPELMQGVYGATASSDTSLPAYKRFARAYEEEFDSKPFPFTPNSYDGMILLALAMVAADSTAGPDINSALPEVANPGGTQVSTFKDGVEALRAGDEINYEGPSGPLDLDKLGNAPSPYAVMQVKGEEFDQVEFYSAEELSG